MQLFLTPQRHDLPLSLASELNSASIVRLLRPTDHITYSHDTSLGSDGLDAPSNPVARLVYCDRWTNVLYKHLNPAERSGFNLTINNYSIGLWNYTCDF